MSLIDNFDIIPVGKVTPNHFIRWAVVVTENAQGFVGKDDPKAKGIICPIPFVDRDLVFGPLFFGQQSEV